MNNFFDKAFDFMIPNEGGYVNDPVDPGGETNYGITVGLLRKLPDEPLLKIPVKEWPMDLVKDFYKRNFWDQGNYKLLISLPIAIKTFDIGVNMGVKTSIRLLQKAYNIFNASKILEDGILGHNTAHAVNFCPSDRLLSCYIECCRARYEYLIRKNPSLKKFSKGWIKRAEKRPDC